MTEVSSYSSHRLLQHRFKRTFRHKSFSEATPIDLHIWGYITKFPRWRLPRLAIRSRLHKQFLCRGSQCIATAASRNLTLRRKKIRNGDYTPNARYWRSAETRGSFNVYHIMLIECSFTGFLKAFCINSDQTQHISEYLLLLGRNETGPYAKGEWGVFEGANDSHSSDTFIFIK